jgi:uncharacterized protein
MLIEFRVTNYRSFKDTQVLNMVASSDTSLPENAAMVKGFGRRRLLKSAVVYGANASGKSNLVKAISFAKNFIDDSATRKVDQPIEVSPFRFSEKEQQAPSKFEFTFIHNNVRYQYGFSVDHTFVHEEWLIAYPHGLPQKWFERVQSSPNAKPKWSPGSKLKGDKQNLFDLTRSDMLFLSLAANLEHNQLKPVHQWFANHLRIVDEGTWDGQLLQFTLRQANRDSALRDQIAPFLRHADLGIEDITIERKIIKDEVTRDLSSHEHRDALLGFLRNILGENEFEKAARLSVQMLHRAEGENGVMALPLEEESQGTRRYFALVGPWQWTLRRGSVLIVDELDASLHPTLARELVRMFHDPEQNPRQAQLIFNTHDTTLLDLSLFRRDQVWFTEKDQGGATQLYPLLDFSPRKGEALQKGYLQGRYGAIPFIEAPLRSVITNGET